VHDRCRHPLPFTIADATRVTEAGYVGEDVGL
jgi:ATP-dependent protease Clp ATPase subunit